jgi:NAD-dependent dihydropyrimidine dehydrogenase PreA subunit
VSIATEPKPRVVLLGSAGHDSESERRSELIRALLEKGHEVSCIRTVGEPGVTPHAGRSTIVVGRFGGRAPVPASSEVQYVDTDSTDRTALIDAVESATRTTPASGSRTWKPWFPVIDYSRCTNCMQCLSFCLFDVYGVSPDRRIQVQNQSNCKTDCPACSRVCPEVAILFPKYRHGPINGDEVSADDVRREAMKVDISALLGGDIYSMLRDRSAKARSRFSKERDDERALKERQTCLITLQRELGVPPEVLAALPSPDEIRAKAEAAAERARRASAGPPES